MHASFPKSILAAGLLLCCVGLVCGLVLPTRAAADAIDAEHSRARYIVFMVPDGLGLAGVTAARVYKNGLDGGPLEMELSGVGYQRTYSADSVLTDSAAAASAWACGEKFKNGEICLHAYPGTHKPSVFETAKKKGKAVGLVATSAITDATPAAFAAHVGSRKCETEIARQYVVATGVDVMLGGGRSKFKPKFADSCGTGGDWIAEALRRGYAVAYTRAQMNAAIALGASKLLGLFSRSGLTPEKKRKPGTTEPRLPEMTTAALAVLEKDPDGFFLVVEGSQVDWAGHDKDLEYQIEETLAFNEAVAVVLDWIGRGPSRKDETLLIIAPDHETGGLAVSGPRSSLVRAGAMVEDKWIGNQHTGTDVVIWSQGPGSARLRVPGLENTFVYQVLTEAMR